ncbi:magnesium/cobalt transporter CorA [Chloroflexota bacterium]
MIRSLYRAPDGQARTDLRPDEFKTALQDTGNLLWVDLGDEPADICEPILGEIFGFHPLAVEDALQESHVPKVDDWGEYLYIVLHAVTFAPSDGNEFDVAQHKVDTPELDVFVGSQYLVTYRSQDIAAVGRLWTACQRDKRHLHKGVAHLLYELADGLVADYMPVVEQLDEAIDYIEERVFTDPDPTLLEQIFALKRAIVHLRRIIAPQREVLNKLARGDYAVIDMRDRVFFRDVYDHLVRLYDINESLRDLVGGAMEAYLSVVNNRMNEVVKTLTIVTAFFMPLAFITGFFGMNFFQAVAPLEPWTGEAMFVLTLATMVLTPVAMYLWMRKRAWM